MKSCFRNTKSLGDTLKVVTPLLAHFRLFRQGSQVELLSEKKPPWRKTLLLLSTMMHAKTFVSNFGSVLLLKPDAQNYWNERAPTLIRIVKKVIIDSFRSVQTQEFPASVRKSLLFDPHRTDSTSLSKSQYV